MTEKIADRVKGVALEEAEKIKDLTTEAARSGAYLYPIRGIVYFVSHKTLWRPLLSKLVPSLSLGVGITVFMFLFTYVPQAAVMTLTQGPLAAVTAGLLVLSESSTLFNFLSKTLLLEETLIDTFDGTLMARGNTSLVAQGRQVNTSGDHIARLGKLIKKPFAKFAPDSIIRYFLYLPLNFIPVVGTVAFLTLQGRRTGPAALSRYFQLKQWNTAQKDRFVEQHKGAFTSFGIAATLLELVPVASLLFAFTNTVGAALWAADIEKGQTGDHGTSPHLVEQIQQAS